MNAYSKKQFAESDTARIRVNETFLDAAGDGNSALWKMRMSPAVWSGSGRSISTVGTGIIRGCVFSGGSQRVEVRGDERICGLFHEKITRERYTR